MFNDDFMYTVHFKDFSFDLLQIHNLFITNKVLLKLEAL